MSVEKRTSKKKNIQIGDDQTDKTIHRKHSKMTDLLHKLNFKIADASPEYKTRRKYQMARFLPFRPCQSSHYA